MFFVFERQPPNTADYKSSVLLIKDHWDDWFKYETQFFMSYVDMMGESHDIGAVKIGQENMEKGQRSPALPVQFNQLPADCFSLGQSDFYYENINHLGDGIREQILANMRDLAYDPDLYAVVRNQEVTRISLMRDVTHFMDLYHLNKAYAIQATTEIAENLPFWKKKYKEWGREEFKTYLTELLAAKESFQYNTWNTALLRALIENIDIVVSEE